MRPTSPFAYLLAVALALVGWTIAVAVAAGAWDPVRDATLTPVTEKNADAAGRTLAVYTDIVQPEREIFCVARTGEGDDSVEDLPAASIDVVVDDDGAQWHLVSLLPRGTDDMKVRCGPRDRRVDDATYAYAVVDGFTSRGRTAQVIQLTGLAAGLGLAIWTFRNRRADRREAAS